VLLAALSTAPPSYDYWPAPGKAALHLWRVPISSARRGLSWTKKNRTSTAPRKLREPSRHRWIIAFELAKDGENLRPIKRIRKQRARRRDRENKCGSAGDFSFALRDSVSERACFKRSRAKGIYGIQATWSSMLRRCVADRAVAVLSQRHP
jgi:hypothetical protein